MRYTSLALATLSNLAAFSSARLHKTNQSFWEKSKMTNHEPSPVFGSDSRALQSDQWNLIGNEIVFGTSDGFYGRSVALSGNGKVAVLTEQRYSNNMGAVYIYNVDQDANTRSLVDTKFGTGTGRFGFSVDIDDAGEIIVVGDFQHNSFAGLVRTYTYEDQQWVSNIDDLFGGPGQDFGYWAALSGDGKTLVVQAKAFQTFTGKVHIYKRDSGNWNKVSEHAGSNQRDYLGTDPGVSFDGTTICLGASQYVTATQGVGFVRILKYNSSTENYEKFGVDIPNPQPESITHFGSHTAISGDGNTIIVSGPGFVYIYKYSDDSGWTQQGSALTGWIVDISGDASVIAVGERNYDNDKGRAATYQWDDTNDRWSEIGQQFFGSNEDDYFGVHLALSADASTFITRESYKASVYNLEVEPIAQVDFSQGVCTSPTCTPYSLHGGAQIKTAPGGTQALRIDSDGPYAKIPGVEIGPTAMPHCTLTIGLYLESITPGVLGWIFGHEQLEFDRTIVLHDSRNNVPGRNMISSAVGVPVWKPWNDDNEIGTAPTKEWFHVTAVFRQGGECSVYVNGVKSDFTITGQNNEGLPDLYVGRPGVFTGTLHTNHYADSWIKEVKVFDAALSDSQVQAESDTFHGSLMNNAPSDSPSNAPSESPSDIPSSSPSDTPSESPSDIPSSSPSDTPSESPSDIPSSSPSDTPSESPSDIPSSSPSDTPSESPSDIPSSSPSDTPSESPSDIPSSSPSDTPSESPSDIPSSSPSDIPSESPSDIHSSSPSDTPSESPSAIHSSSPSDTPSESPSDIHSSSPSDTPSEAPSDIHSSSPSDTPSDTPSDSPSDIHSSSPSSQPSDFHSESPSDIPSSPPSDSPSDAPSDTPSLAPSFPTWWIANATFVDHLTKETSYLTLTHDIGTANSELELTLYEYDCETEVETDAALSFANEGISGRKASYNVVLTKESVGSSGFLEGGDELQFCVGAGLNVPSEDMPEGIDDYGSSIVSKKTKIAIAFDLTDATFTVTQFVTQGENPAETDITADDNFYEMEACICSTSFDCDSATGSVATQEENSVVFICLKPPTGLNFEGYDMIFSKGNGPVADSDFSYNAIGAPFTSEETEGNMIRVRTQLLSGLFDVGEQGTAQVSGTGNFVFDTNAKDGKEDEVEGNYKMFVGLQELEDCEQEDLFGVVANALGLKDILV